MTAVHTKWGLVPERGSRRVLPKRWQAEIQRAKGSSQGSGFQRVRTASAKALRQSRAPRVWVQKRREAEGEAVWRQVGPGPCSPTHRSLACWRWKLSSCSSQVLKCSASFSRCSISSSCSRMAFSRSRSSRSCFTWGRRGRMKAGRLDSKGPLESGGGTVTQAWPRPASPGHRIGPGLPEVSDGPRAGGTPFLLETQQPGGGGTISATLGGTSGSKA